MLALCWLTGPVLVRAGEGAITAMAIAHPYEKLQAKQQRCRQQVSGLDQAWHAQVSQGGAGDDGQANHDYHAQSEPGQGVTPTQGIDQ